MTDAYGQSLKTLSPSPGEVKKIVENYENASVVVVSSGINQKHVDEDVLRAKQGKGSVHMYKTNHAALLDM